MSEGEDQSLRLKAEKIVDNKIGFYIHLTAYIAVNTMFVLMWAINDGIDSFPWFIFITLPWGIGLIAHFMGAFITPSIKERMVKKEMGKIRT